MSTAKIVTAIERMKAYFDPYISTDRVLWERLYPLVGLKEIHTRGVIKEGEECESELRFVLKGGGVKLEKRNDQEYCFDIAVEGEFLSDLQSLHNGMRSTVIIRNFEPMRMAVIKRTDLLALYDDSVTGAQMGRILVEVESAKAKWRSGLLEHTLSKRYNLFCKEKPYLSQRVPQIYIASYLGTYPQSISRVRRGRRGES